MGYAKVAVALLAKELDPHKLRDYALTLAEMADVLEAEVQLLRAQRKGELTCGARARSAGPSTR